MIGNSSPTGTHISIVEAAVSRAGSVEALAAGVGVGRSAISNWKRDGIPVKRVAAVSRITGLSLSDLRPDMFGAGEA